MAPAPRRARARATDRPITPPPITTTSAVFSEGLIILKGSWTLVVGLWSLNFELCMLRLSKTKDQRPKTKYVMKHTITLIPGDGIGPEVASNVVRIIEASGVEIEWETHYAGAQALEKFGNTLPDSLLESIRRNRVALKGPITTPIGKGFTSVNVGLRKTLDLYANLRPVRALPNVPCHYPDLDLVFV